MKKGLLTLLALIIATMTMIPICILGKYLGGGLILSYIFSPVFYLLIWVMKIKQPKDSPLLVIGLIPILNIMYVYALLIILYTKKLGGDLGIYTD